MNTLPMYVELFVSDVVRYVMGRIVRWTRTHATPSNDS